MAGSVTAKMGCSSVIQKIRVLLVFCVASFGRQNCGPSRLQHGSLCEVPSKTRDVLLLCTLGYISTLTLDGLFTKNENCSLPPWIFIELLNCYVEFVRTVAMCQSHIKAELHENVGVPKSFLSHKIHRFKKYRH